MRSSVPFRLRSMLAGSTRLAVLLALVVSVLGVGALTSPAGAAAVEKTFNCGGGYQVPTTLTLNNAPTSMYVNESSNAAKGSLLMKFPGQAELDMSYHKKPFTIPPGETLGGTTFDLEVKWLEVGGASVAGDFGGKSTSLSFRFAKEEMKRAYVPWSIPIRYESDGWNWTSTAVDVPLTAPATPGRYPVTFNSFGLPLAQSGPLTILGIPLRDEVPLGSETWQCVAPAGGISFPNITVRSRSHVSLVVNPGSVQQGTAASAQAAVRVDGGQATGRVEFFEVGNPSVVLGSTNVVNGNVPNVALSLLPAGEHEISARFLPSDTSLYDASTATDAAVLTVRPPNDTATALTVDPLNILTTESTTATAEVSSAAGTPGGSVIFTVDGVDRPAMALTNGKVSLVLTGLAKGSHPISARFVPANANLHNPSVSLQRTIQVTKLADPSSTSITVTPNPAYTTDTVTARATVSIQGASPAQGNVDWTIVGTDAGNTVYETPQGVVGANGQVNLDLSHLPAGEYSVAADFTPAPGSDQAPSSAAAVNLTVKRAPATTTTTTLALSATTVWTGESVTATATVAPTSPAPEGEVVFTVDGVDQDPLPMSNRSASYTLANLTEGVHEVAARFVPSDPLVFTASAASTRSILVKDKPPVVTTTALVVAPGTITEDESATATATVTAPEGTLAGDVVFTVRQTDGTIKRHTKAFRPGGVPLVLDGLAPDTYSVTAEFVPAPGAGFTPSTSGAKALVVTKAPAATSSTSLALSRRTASTTDTVTASASVATGRGVGVGKVRFSHGSTTQLVDLVDGTASVALTNLAVGDNAVTAAFVPADLTRQLASTSAPRTVTLTQAPDSATVTTLGLSRSTFPTNGSTVATAQVASVSGTPSGQIAFKVDGTEVARRDVVDGQAQATIGPLAVGSRSLVATFVPAPGSKQTGSSSAPQSVTVVPAPGPSPTVTVLSLSRTVVATGEGSVATAKVSSAGGVVEGSVEFTYDGATVTVPLDASDQASTTITTTRPAALPVKARFVSSAPESANSLAPDVTLTANNPRAAVSATTLALSTTRASVGEVVTATATVSTSAAQPAGLVRFLRSGVELARGPVDPDTGRVSADLANLATGQHVIVAEFVPGDLAAIAASTSAETAVDIIPAGAVNLSLSAGTVVEGATLTATAAVTATGASTSGVVTFRVGGKSVAAPVANGSATAALPSLAPGSYDVVAEFDATDAQMPTVHSQKRQVTVTAKAAGTPTGPSRPAASASSLRVVLASPSVAYGASTPVTAWVAPGAAGVVQFTVGGFSLDAKVVDGRATVSLPRTLAVGSHTVNASFVPTDAGAFAPSSATAQLGVVKDQVKVRFGQRYFTAERLYQIRGRVSGVNGSLGAGRAKVTLMLGTKRVGKATVALDCNGYAEAHFKIKKPGVYTVLLTYAGSDSLEPYRAKKTKKMGGN